MSDQPLISNITDTIQYEEIPEYLKTDYLEHISQYAYIYRKQGCQWIIDSSRCRKECIPHIFYCEAHKDISDIDRHVLITSCRKRK